MITYVTGDVLQSPARVLVNAVNTAGVMGKGIARDFKTCFPDMFEVYRDRCQRGDFEVGQLMLYRTPHKWVLNFPTKRHWRNKSRLQDIESGLRTFVAMYAQKGITSISFPRLGSGFGGLDWEREVCPLLESYLHPLPIPVYVHAYDEDDPYLDDNRNIRTVRAWLEGKPQTVNFDKFWRDITRLLRKKSKFKAIDTGRKFSVGHDNRRKGKNLIILADEPQPLFLSESILVDLWTYVRTAGYARHTNLPGGLDESADVVMALLCQLDYVQPVHLQNDDGTQDVGMHFVTPTHKHGATHHFTLTVGSPD